MFPQEPAIMAVIQSWHFLKNEQQWIASIWLTIGRESRLYAEYFKYQYDTFFFLSLHCGGEAATAAAAATSLWAHLPYFPPFLLSCASVCACVRVHVWLSLMLMYALGMTLIDLAALLAKYSFFPNLSLSWLLWLLISQLQKPPWMQRGFCALRLPSLSLSLSLYSLSVVLSLSCASSSCRVSVSFPHFLPHLTAKWAL